MVQINFARREVSCKLVYYGPGMCGKTTNLQKVFEKAPDNSKGNLTSIATEGDRTLFFDFLPIDLGEVAGMRTKFQLYTVPGQVYYASTRKLVLQGADGVVFVADSQPAKLQENLDSIKDLEDNLKANGIDIEKLPWVIQWNKRDVPNAVPVAELEQRVNLRKVPTTEAIAYKGEGVMPTLKLIAKLVLDKMNKEYGRPGARSSAAPAAPAATASPAPATPAPAPPAPAVKAPPPAPAPVAPPPPKPAPAAPPPPPPAPKPAPAMPPPPAAKQKPSSPKLPAAPAPAPAPAAASKPAGGGGGCKKAAAILVTLALGSLALLVALVWP